MKTTKQRLANYRQRYEKAVHKSPRGPLGHKYRNTWDVPRNTRSDDGGEIYTESRDQFGDYLGDAHDLIRLDHTGWYVDGYHSGLMIGGVCKLRCPKGTLYIPVTYCDEWDGSTHYIGDVELVEKGSDESAHDAAIREAARSADYYAEREAEKAREAWVNDQAQREIEEKREDIHEINQTALPLIAEIKKAGKAFSGPVCQALRRDLSRLMAKRRAAFNRIERLIDEPWIIETRYC